MAGQNKSGGSTSTPYNQVSTVTPILHDFQKESENYMGNFWAKADGFVANKFHIGFRGEYVEKALTVMQRNAMYDKYTKAKKTYCDTATLYQRFKEWVDLCWNTNTRMLSMLWSCKSVTLPNPTLETAKLRSIDSIKDITYSVPTRIKDGQVTLQVVDNQYLMWFNFFNALFNCQVSPLVLKAANGFHKIDMNVELLGGQTGGVSPTEIQRTGLDIYQMSEYNSILLTSAPVVNPDNASQELTTFTVTFDVPNTLNGTFKKSDRGLMDNTSTGQASIFTGKTGFAYKLGFWERSVTNMENTKNSYDALSADDLKTFKEHGEKFTKQW